MNWRWSSLAFAVAACSLPPATEPPRDARELDTHVIDATRQPSKIDILVVSTQGGDRYTWVNSAAVAIEQFVRELSAPSGPTRDLHFGVTTSKLDLPTWCTCPPNRASCNEFSVTNDATLRAPHTWQLNPPDDWMPAMRSHWPPRWKFLTSDLAQSLDLAKLAARYIYELPQDADCGVTQYLEVAARAIDGRNPGFVRPESLLVLILLGHMEDCSTLSPVMWDPAIWHTSFGGPYCWSNDRCYDPPPGLLVPVESYPGRFQALHPSGRVLIVAVAVDAKPEWSPSDVCPTVKALCSSRVNPGQRLAQLVRVAEAGRSASNVDAMFADACFGMGSTKPAVEGLKALSARITGSPP